MKNFLDKYFLYIVWVTAVSCSITIPLFFPNNDQTVSMSYDVGFNNRIGFAIIVFFSFVFFLFSFLRKNAPAYNEINLFAKSSNTNNVAFLSTIVSTALLFLLYSIFCSPYILYMGEGSYFTLHVYDTLMGLSPYKDFVYYYGPFSIYFPIIIYKILPFLGIEASYVFSLALTQIACLVIAKDLLSIFSFSNKTRGFILILIAISFFPYSMGFNSCLIRYVLAPWLFVKLVNVFHSKGNLLGKTIFLFASNSITLLVSPEVWIIYSVISFLFLIIDTIIRKEYRQTWAILSMIVSCVLLYYSFPSLFTVISDFSSGCNNLPFVPSLAFLLLIISILVVAGHIGYLLKSCIENYVVILFYLICLSSIPAALGRTDPIHIVYNGWLVVLLALNLCITKHQKQIKMIYFMVSFFFLIHIPFNVISYGRIYIKECLANLYENKAYVFENCIPINIDNKKAIKRIVKYKKELPFKMNKKERVTMPIMTNNFYYLHLRNMGIYCNTYFPKIWFSATNKNVNRMISEMNDKDIDCLLLPADWQNFIAPDNKHNSLLFLCPPFFENKRNGNFVYKPMFDYIENNFMLVESSGEWLKYKKK